MKLAGHQWQPACENTLTHQNLNCLINLVFHGIKHAYEGVWFGRNIKTWVTQIAKKSLMRNKVVDKRHWLFIENAQSGI